MNSLHTNEFLSLPKDKWHSFLRLNPGAASSNKFHWALSLNSYKWYWKNMDIIILINLSFTEASFFGCIPHSACIRLVISWTVISWYCYNINYHVYAYIKLWVLFYHNCNIYWLRWYPADYFVSFKSVWDMRIIIVRLKPIRVAWYKVKNIWERKNFFFID